MGAYEDLMGGGSAPAEAAKPPPLPSAYSDLLGDGSSVGNQPKGTKMRDPQDSLEGSAGFFTAMRASLAPDTQDQIKRFAAARFPDEYKANPEGVLKRYGIIDGNIVYTDQEGTVQREVPSVFREGAGLGEKFMRLGRFVASQVGPSIPQAAGAAAGTAMGPTPLSIPAAGVAAGVTDVARQAADRALAGEDPTDVDLLNSLGHAGQAAAGQGVAVGANRLLARNELGVSPYDRTQAMDPARRQDMNRLLTESRARDVDLSAGQATDLRSLKVQERRLGRFDETQDRMADFARNQRETQVPAAVRQEIARVSPQGGEQAVRSFREGAEQVVTQAQEARAAQAATLYDEAFAANQNVQSRVVDRILQTPAGKRALRNTAEKMQNDMSLMGVPDKDLTEQARYVAELGQDVPPPRQGVASGLKLRTLDYVKRSLDDMADSANRSGSRDDARIIGNLKRQLVRELDRADVTAQAGPNSVRPEGGAYARARAAYGAGSDALEAIMEGGTGFINRIEGMDRQNIVNRAFSASNIMPEEVARMRGQFAAAGRQDDFNAGVASWLSDKLADAMKTNASGSMGNVPGKMHASVWGDERQQLILRAALGGSGPRVEGMESLMRVLQAAARSLPEGSPTATDMGAMSGVQTVGRGLQVAGKVLSPGTALNIGDELVKGIDALRTPQARIALAEAVLSGDYNRQLTRLRILPPNGERAMALAGQIVASALVTVTGARTPADRPIPGDATTQGLQSP